MWERKSVNVKKLGECLYLDSGTLTPLLKKLESKGFVTRMRYDKYERNLVVAITNEGKNLRIKPQRFLSGLQAVQSLCLRKVYSCTVSFIKFSEKRSNLPE